MALGSKLIVTDLCVMVHPSKHSVPVESSARAPRFPSLAADDKRSMVNKQLGPAVRRVNI